MRLRTREIAGDIPTSSMADVAFLLVIYFMLTATFTATQGLDLGLPKRPDHPVDIDPVESVLVEVQADGHLLVDSRPLDLVDLLEYLRPRLERNPDKPVIVKTDPSAPYGAMVAVLDELRQGRERLGREQDIAIAIPTERQQEQYWR